MSWNSTERSSLRGVQRKPVPLTAYTGDVSYSPAPDFDPQDPYRDDITSAPYPSRRISDTPPGETPATNMSEATLQREKYPAYPYVTDFGVDQRPYPGAQTPVDYPLKSEYNQISVDPVQREGMKIQPGWRRQFLTWLLALLALTSFVITVLFAYNASRGNQADTRFIFSNPGKTILVLQILTNISTTLFGELLVASCEMLRWAFATGGTRFTTFLGLSRATALYGMFYLLLARHVTFFSKFMILQRMLIYALVFTSSFILLTSLSIPLSFPVVQTYTNGSSGLGPFGSSVAIYSMPAFHFSGFTEDATSIVGVDPLCDEGCYSYFLPGTLDAVNSSWYHVTQGIQGLNGTSYPSSLGMGSGNFGPLLGMMGLLGGNSTDGAQLGTLLSGILGGDINSGDLSSLLGNSDLGSLLGGLLGGGLGNLTNAGGLLGGLGNMSLPAGLLGGLGNMSIPDGLLGGLKRLAKRQSDPASGSLLGGLSQIEGNYIDWTGFAANETKVAGTPELAYVTENTKGYRLDFTPLVGAWPPFNNYCSNYSTVLGLSLVSCVATEIDAQNVSSIVAGFRVCDPTTLFGQPCPDPNNITMQYTTQMDVSWARATTAYSLRNATILSIQGLTETEDYPIDVQYFFQAFTSPFQQTNLFAALDLSNPSASSSVTSQLVLSLIADFAFAGQGPLSGNYQLRNVMAYAMTIGSLEQDEVENSGRQFVTKIAYTIQLASYSLYVYIALGGVILLWCFSVLAWCSWTTTANTSGFPEIDFATKWVPPSSAVEGMSNATSRGVLRKLGGKMKVFLGEGVKDAGDGLRRVVVLESAPAEPLRRDAVYS